MSDAPLELVNRRWIRTVRRLAIDERGLTEESIYGQVRLLWHEVLGVRWARRRAILQLKGRTLVIDGRFGDWEPFVREVERRASAFWRASEASSVSAQEIAQWLMIRPGGRLVCDCGRRRVWGWVVLGLAGLLLLASGIVASGTWLFRLYALNFAMFAISMILTADVVSAGVDGISVRLWGKPRTYAWSEIERVRNGPDGLRVMTARGSFVISTSGNGERLLNALHRVIEAKRQGLELPADVPVSETALSRLTGDEDEGTAVERGLSRPET